VTVTAPAPNLDLLTAARQWYDAGYCVVPSHEDGGKRPFGAWKQYQTERPTWEQVEAWLATGRYTGIGVITGAVSGNVEMIELEGPEPDAVQAFNKIRAKAAPYVGIDLAGTFAKIGQGCVERSAGGGLHMFVRCTQPVPGNTKLAADEQGHVIAETRGEGGFVIVAPTPARSGHGDGTIYMLIGDSTPDKTPTLDEQDLQALHFVIAEALHSHTDDLTPLPVSKAQTTPPTAPAPSQGQESPLAPWDDYARRTSWAQILAPLGWQQGMTAPDGRTHWTRPGKDPREGTSATTIEDGPMYVFSTSTVFPAGVGMSKQHVFAVLHHDGDHKAAARALLDEGYGERDDGPALPPWEVDLDAATPEQVEDERERWVLDKLPALNWADLWAEDNPDEWIVEPLLPARRLVALYSAPKVGKSLLMLEIAAAVASGKDLFGSKTKQARVLYVDFENDPRGDVRQRLQDMGYTPEQLSELYYLSFPTLSGLDSERGSQELMAAAEVYDCEVIVIDTVSRSVDGDENENDTWLAFYRHTGLKMKQAKKSMIRLDHSGKDEKKGQRGGSAKSGDVDAVWRLSRVNDDMIELTCEAQRLQIDRKNLTLRRETEPLRHEVSKDPFMDKQAALFALFREKKVPKDRSMNVTNARALARESCGPIANFNRATWDAWCDEPGEMELPL
jgi:hypothetical protein